MNGNIIHIIRDGNDSGKTFDKIDDITLKYKGNRLLSADDFNTDDQYQQNGFTDNGSFESKEYEYDHNGNLTNDLNKKITQVEYNFQNLPESITLVNDGNFNQIFYQYDAVGNKLCKQIRTNGALVKTTDYFSAFETENNTLKRITTAERQAVPMGEKGFEYQYFLKDHLGSTRVVLNQNKHIEQQNSYYPFGMLMSGIPSANTYTPNKYLYNGKELQDDFSLNWYDYGKRFYGTQLGRWHIIDSHAEKYYSRSPYTYVYNRPINAFDPDGRDGIVIVFPDYKISMPIGKIGGLGHAGVLLIDNKTGYTKYYEYGMYDKENKGIVRSFGVYNVKMGKDGMPTQKSLDKVMKQISDKAGHKGKIEGAYIKSDKFKEMNDYAQEKMKENSNPDRKEYSLTTNNCGTFALDVVKQDEDVKKDAPVIIDPRPNSIIKEYQDNFQGVHYNPKTTTTTIDPKKDEEH